MLITALFLLAAAPKPPACDATTNGVIWNFGSVAAPNLRQCDGISYVPVQLCPPCTPTPATAPAPTAATPRPAPASAPAAAPEPAPTPAPKPAPSVPIAGTRNDCTRVCGETQKTCLSDCLPSRNNTVSSDLQEKNCKEACGTEQATCSAAGWKQFPAKQPTRAP